MANPRKSQAAKPPAAVAPPVAPEPKPEPAPKIHLKFFGIGGAGGNVVSQIASERAGGCHLLAGVELFSVNTDLQALSALNGAERVQIGHAQTHGLGAGGEVEAGARAAQQDAERLEALVQGADLVFIAAGLGGGTGTGAAPVLARLAKEQGALVLAMVTLPFGFEGERRRLAAFNGLEQLRAQADAVVCIQNEKLFKAVGEKATVLDAFAHANRHIARGAEAIWQLLARKGLVNLDFAAIRATLGAKRGDGVFSYGEAQGADRVRDAVKALLENPLFDGNETLARAEGVLVSVLGGPELTLSDVQRAVEPISRVASRAQVIMGAAIDDGFRDRLSVTVIASANLLPKRALQPAFGRTTVSRPSSLRVAPGAPAKDPVATPKKETAQPKQETLPLEGATRGRFDKSEPTLYNGEDLDQPTFMRRGVNLRK